MFHHVENTETSEFGECDEMSFDSEETKSTFSIAVKCLNNQNKKIYNF